MEESIYISNFRKNEGTISDYISSLKNKSNFCFSSIHEKNDILKIVLHQNQKIGIELIEKHSLTCVVENQLFRTVYSEGIRVMWKSLHD